MDSVAQEVQQIFADLTRYPPEILALDADLEEELGIDSVKLAEILTVSRQRFQLPDSLEVPIERLRTIGSIAELIRQQKSNGQPASPPPTPPPARDLEAATAAPAASADTGTRRWLIESVIRALETSLEQLPGNGNGHGRPAAPAPAPTWTAPKVSPAPEPAREASPPSPAEPELAARVIDTIAELTRYPREILTPEASLEEDLGIDSVKQAEILAALRDRLRITAEPAQNGFEIATIGDVIRLASQLRDTGSPAPAPPEIAPGPPPAPAAEPPRAAVPVRTRAYFALDNPRPFAGKVALITGSGHGIGKAIACRLAALGATVAVNSFHSRERGEAATEEILAAGGQAFHLWGSVAKSDQLERIFAEVEQQAGHLDFFVSNASNGMIAPLSEVTEEHWEKAFRTNVVGLHQGALQAARLMRRQGGGKIVTLSSPGAHQWIEYFGCMGPIKAAVESLTRYLAIELSPDNIQVNAISAGPIYGELLSRYPDAGRLIPYWESLSAGNRLGEEHDVAEFVTYMLSPAADKITGSVLLVDSGGSQRI